MVLLLEEQAEGLFRTELGDAGEIFHAESVKNLSSLQFAFAQTEWAFDGVARHC